jgi:head-tail adaptor
MIGRGSPTIGATRHYVDVFEPGIPVADGNGGWSETVNPLDPPHWYCSIEAIPTPNTERASADTAVLAAGMIFRGRYHPAITTRTRIALGPRRFEVQSVQDVDLRQQVLALVCLEIIDGRESNRVARPYRA